jgi:hypothetical protein
MAAACTSLGYNISDDNAAGLLTGTGDQVDTEPDARSAQEQWRRHQDARAALEQPRD